MKKLLVVGILLLLVGVSIPSTGRILEQASTMTFDGNTLYVGGSGPGNYTKIQDAIDNSSDGDKVFVFSGVYFENLIIAKSISLIGENKYNTFIWSVIPNNGCTLTVIADSVVIQDFGIFNSSCSRPGINILGSENSVVSDCNLHLNYNGMEITNSNNIIIENCSFTDKGISFYNTNNSLILNCSIKYTRGYGIYLDESTHNEILNCVFHDNSEGIYLDFSSTNNTIQCCHIYSSRYSGIRIDKSSFNLIKECNISYCDLQGISITGSSKMNSIHFNNLLSNYNIGIQIYHANKNNIFGNIIDKIHPMVGSTTLIGIELRYAFNNTIEQNTISNTLEKGIILTDSNNNSIIHNNFRENEFDAFFKNSYRNIWSRNFWNRIRFLSKPICGVISLPFGGNLEIYLLWLNFDFRPAIRSNKIGE